MEVFPYQIKINKGKYCSPDCIRKGISKTLTGSKQSDITKQKRSKSLTGFVYKNRDKNYKDRTGSLHWNWKGGVTSDNKKLRSSIEYRLWRLKILERDKFTCQECEKSKCDLEVHHIKIIKKFPELLFNINNGITLCNNCHNKTKWKEEKFENKYILIIKKLSLAIK